jgi:hypothetical protein
MAQFPDLNVALLPQHARQRLVPSLTVGSVKLDVENVFMVLPCLAEHEALLRRRVYAQDRLVEHGFAPHGIEDALQELEELTALLRRDIKPDEIGHRH